MVEQVRAAAPRSSSVSAKFRAASTNEVGQGNNGLIPWLGMQDPDEQVPELAWPRSIKVFDRMRNDAQCDSIYQSMVKPIMNYDWFIDPKKARDEVVEKVSKNLNLPILGQEDDGDSGRSRDKFSWKRHLHHCLLKIVYGHMFFEQIYKVEDDDTLSLKKLAPRMPATIQEIFTADDGGLLAIRQYASGRLNTLDPLLIQLGLSASAVGDAWNQQPLMSVDRLVAYIHEQEGGNWVGRSIFRKAYKHWLINDRLMRVDAIKHERNGMGNPIIEAPPGASQVTINHLDQLAQRLKVGEASGGAIPSGAKLRLVGVEGSLPDTLASIRYHDEQIAKVTLAMFLQLGLTQTGNRSLGETFLEFFESSQHYLADSVVATTNAHVIEDLVDFNYGEDENVPGITYRATGKKTLAIADMVSLVDAGILNVDKQLEAYMREAYNLPDVGDPREQDLLPPHVVVAGDPASATPSVGAPAPAAVAASKAAATLYDYFAN